MMSSSITAMPQKILPTLFRKLSDSAAIERRYRTKKMAKTVVNASEVASCKDVPAVMM